MLVAQEAKKARGRRTQWRSGAAEEGTVPRRVLEDARNADGDDPHGDDTVIHAEEDYVRPRY